MKTEQITMAPLNLTFEEKRETHKIVDELYKVHEKTSASLKQIFTSPEGNSYSRAATAAEVYQAAAAESGAKVTKAIEDATKEVAFLRADFYDRSAGQDTRLSEVNEWIGYLLEVSEEQATDMIEGNQAIKQAAMQYVELYPDDEEGIIAELMTRAFENTYEDQVAAPKELATLLPILQESFSTTLEAGFTQHTQHNYLDSAEILAARV